MRYAKVTLLWGGSEPTPGWIYNGIRWAENESGAEE